MSPSEGVSSAETITCEGSIFRGNPNVTSEENISGSTCDCATKANGEDISSRYSNI